MIKKIKLEPFIVGTIIFISLILLSLMIFLAGNYTLKRGFHFYALFKFSDGVLKNAPVMISGVKFGKIEDINLVKKENDTYIKIKVWLERGDVIFKNTKVFINSAGLMGEKYIEIDPGSPSAGYVKEGEEIRGIDPLKTNEIFEKIHNILFNLDKVVTSVTELFYEEQTRQRIIDTIENLKQSSRALVRILEKNDETITSAIKNIEVTSRELRKSSEEINEIIKKSSNRIVGSIENLTNSANSFSKSINEISKSIPDITKNVQKSSENVSSITEKAKKDFDTLLSNLNTLSANLSKLSEDIKDKKGNIGALIYSNEIAKNLNEASKNIKDTTKYIKHNPWVLFKQRKEPLTKQDFKGFE
ncbi:MAG TPA: MlaD family protein [bacterium]|nr:MlaD family protein [bacterium]HOL47192.1 MlaD family protein [bacterium]HPQ17684.1 MlaD family protein [bacterium]